MFSVKIVLPERILIWRVQGRSPLARSAKQGHTRPILVEILFLFVKNVLLDHSRLIQVDNPALHVRPALQERSQLLLALHHLLVVYHAQLVHTPLWLELMAVKTVFLVRSQISLALSPAFPVGIA